MTDRKPGASRGDGIDLGPATRERAARVLEQQLGAVWAAVLESHGVPAEAPWRVVVGQLWLEPVPGEDGAVPRDLPTEEVVRRAVE